MPQHRGLGVAGRAAGEQQDGDRLGVEVTFAVSTVGETVDLGEELGSGEELDTVDGADARRNGVLDHDDRRCRAPEDLASWSSASR